jgi:ComF family protein
VISKAAADAALDLLLAARCAGCGAPGAWLCLACRELCEPVRHGRVTAAGTYGGALREAIHHFKYGGERALANELGELVAACVARDLATGVALDVVVPAVLHPQRARSRGYDQAWLLADAVARRTALPMRVPLRRIRLAVPQISLDRAARAENLRGAYVAEAAVRGARVALVDDVATTGATLAAATGALRAAGARAVRSYVVALDA